MSSQEQGKNRSKYESLRNILSAPADPESARQYLQTALENALAALAVDAASVVVFDEGGKKLLNVRAGEEGLAEVLQQLEERMIASLRSQFGVESLYSTLNHHGLKSLFSYMIKSGDRTVGAISGICEGSRNIALEQEFIEAVASALRYVYGKSQSLSAARMEAVRETTTTINHEINNPLTVVLGNVQLLLMKSEELPEDVVRRLKLIEQSSLRIRDVVGKLLRLTEAKSKTYLENSRMIDLGDTGEGEE